MRDFPLLVVSDPSDFPDYPGPRISAREFLEAPAGPGPVVNLCRSWSYLSEGYYVSLLAEARGLEVSPEPSTIVAVRNPRFVLRALGEAGVPVVDLDAEPEHGVPEAIASKGQSTVWLRERHEGGIRFRAAEESETARVVVCLGRCAHASFRTLARAAYRVWRLPLFELRLLREESRWKIVHVAPLGVGELSEEERAELGAALARAAAPALEARPRPRASLAVLFEDNDPHQPSSPETIDRLAKVAARLGLHVQRLSLSGLARLGDFDALLIRCLTGPDLPSFAFALQAEALGMPVVDDTTSILRCCNKVYLHELLTREGIQQPETRVASSRTTYEELAAELGSPFVIKLPDGSFSTAVFKITSAEDYAARATPLLARSPLLLAQRFLPTDFDWRIGFMGGRALFACKYHMARGHWQIASQSARGPRFGKTEAVSLQLTPPAVLEVARQAAALVGDGFYGVDLKELEDGRVVVIEVNDNPNLDLGYEDAFEGDRVYEAIAQGFLDRIQRGFEPPARVVRTRRAADEDLQAWRQPIVSEGATATPPYRAFEVCGLELEYALVDRDLNRAPLVEATLAALAGRPTSEIELGAVGLTNEIVDHVLEIRTDVPLPSLVETEAVLVEGVRRVGALLATRQRGARLLPTAMHPWLDPTQAALWTRSNRRIYQTYERLFETKVHGWRNVQSCHVNLPLGTEEEAVALLNACALLVPYLPALAASSPMLEGELGPAVCNRLAHVLTHQLKIPETQGQLVPEYCESLSAYRRDIFKPMFKAIDALPESRAIRGEFLNARGAVIKFSRQSLEVRVLDTQECVRLDVAIACFVRWSLAWLSGELQAGRLALPDHGLLVADLQTCVQVGSKARVHAPYLPDLARDGEGRASVSDLLRQLLGRARTCVTPDEAHYLDLVAELIDSGSLSERIVAQLRPLEEDEDAFTEAARRIYIELADCLLDNEPWSGRGLEPQG